MKRVWIINIELSICTFLGLAACRCHQGENVARAREANEVPSMYAMDRFEIDDTRDFYKRVFGKDEFATSWVETDRLRSGSAIEERRPYLDSWYPERSGGTNIQGAITRYDKAFSGTETNAANWEATEHGHAEPNWFGHCNGTSVASTRYLNPRDRVLRPAQCTVGTATCTEFSPADIRALLAEISMNTKAKFIAGKRCKLTRGELDGRPTLRINPQIMDDCDDVNPGNFHTALINFLGRMKQPLVFDYNQDEEVWNYPIFSYSYNAEGPFNETQAIAASGLAIDSWIFNPNASSWYKVAMTVSYRISSFGLDGAGTVPSNLDSRTYDYMIELDEAGQIIGGEWLGDSRREHPDFIWMPFEPAEPTGSNAYGNPYVSNKEVIKLWAESVGLNPADPFHDKPGNPYDVRFYPLEDLSWGTVTGYYQLLLDGRTTGSAFLGKKTHLRIGVTDALKSDAAVELLLNGQSLSSSTPQDGIVDFLFDPSPGINILSLHWTSSRVDSSEVNWDFRFFAM